MSIRQERLHLNSINYDSNAEKQLWRKLKQGSQKQNKEIQSTIDKISKPQSPISKRQVKINEFLQKLHHKISDSLNVSQSDVVEKISINWQEDLGNQYIAKLNVRNGSFEQKVNIYTPRLKKCNCQTLYFSDIESIEHFMEIIELKNVRLHWQMSKIIDNSSKMELQCKNLQNKIEKNQEKILKLNHCISSLQKTNKKLNEDFQKLKKEVEIQISIEQQRISYKYEKIIQQLKQQTEKKLSFLKMSQTTCGSVKKNSEDKQKLSQRGETASKQKSVEKSESEVSRIQNSQSSQKRKKITRSNKNNFSRHTPSFSTKPAIETQIRLSQRRQWEKYKNQKESCKQKTENISSAGFKYNPTFDKLLNSFIKQQKKQMKNYRVTSQ